MPVGLAGRLTQLPEPSRAKLSPRGVGSSLCPQPGVAPACVRLQTCRSHPSSPGSPEASTSGKQDPTRFIAHLRHGPNRTYPAPARTFWRLRLPLFVAAQAQARCLEALTHHWRGASVQRLCPHSDAYAPPTQRTRKSALLPDPQHGQPGVLTPKGSPQDIFATLGTARSSSNPFSPKERAPLPGLPRATPAPSPCPPRLGSSQSCAWLQRGDNWLGTTARRGLARRGGGRAPSPVSPGHQPRGPTPGPPRPPPCRAHGPHRSAGSCPHAATAAATEPGRLWVAVLGFFLNLIQLRP